ncbi:MAG: hypothetical protein WKG01_10345 [Kofleriaceae bacterium]
MTATLVRILTLALVSFWSACGGSSPSRTDGGTGDDPCDVCTPDQICIQRFDGTCGLATSCVTPNATCADKTCSAACENAYCPRPYQCTNRAPCGDESPDAFTCYGP